MEQRIGMVALVVREYDEAIRYYTKVLGFELVEDTELSASKRWVVVRPRGTSGPNLLLARASTEEQASRIGNQTGGRVFLFLETDDFVRDYGSMRENGVHFLEEPRAEDYGTVVQFEDLYGNRFDLIERAR